MILEIEFYKGDALLTGKHLNEHSLRKLLKNVKRQCGDSGDLAETLCRNYGFERITAEVFPDWRYDRDTGLLYKPRGAADRDDVI